MRAIVITTPGGLEVLEERDVPSPVPREDEVLVRIIATAVNRADLLQIAGRYPAPAGWPADIPGLEYAGVVEASGPGVHRWRAGDRVMGLAGGGTYAEYITVHQDEVLAVPAAIDTTQAAAIPEAFLTAHDALIEQAGLAPGESVLIHAIASGVGTAALQVATGAGARVVGTSRTAWKLERAAEIAPFTAVDTSSADFAQAALDATGGRGVDVVLDLVGGGYLAGNVRALAPRGRLMVVGLVAGAAAELDMRSVLRKRLTIRGTALRGRNHVEKAAVTEAFRAWGPGRFDAGGMRPVVDQVYPLAEVRAALEHVQRNQSFGKIVLRVAEDA